MIISFTGLMLMNYLKLFGIVLTKIKIVLLSKVTMIYVKSVFVNLPETNYANTNSVVKSFAVMGSKRAYSTKEKTNEKK